MSFSSEEEVSCPCGETFTAELWNSINLKEDPFLRGLLMGGALNVVPCSMCKTMVYAERFVLVHDPANELLIFVHPKEKESERDLLEIKMLHDVAEAQNTKGAIKILYPPILLFGMDSVVELLQKEDEIAAQSDILGALSPTLPVNLVKISPSVSRETGLPRQVPLAGGGTMGDRLTSGLEAALSVNDRLTIYADLLKTARDGKISEEAFSILSRRSPPPE